MTNKIDVFVDGYYFDIFTAQNIDLSFPCWNFLADANTNFSLNLNLFSCEDIANRMHIFSMTRDLQNNRADMDMLKYFGLDENEMEELYECYNIDGDENREKIKAFYNGRYGGKS